MLVLYFFQGEPGECMDVPNGFMIPQDGAITFGNFIKYFPQNISTCHCRFRMEDSSCGYVWVDVKDPMETLPVFEGAITAKILRANPIAEHRRHLLLKKKTQVEGFLRRENDAIKYQIGPVGAIPSSSSATLRQPTKSVSVPAASTNQPNPSKIIPQSGSSNPLQSSADTTTKTAPQPAVSASTTPPVVTRSAPVANLLDDDDDVHNSFVAAHPPSQSPIPNIFEDDNPFGSTTTSSMKVPISLSSINSNGGLEDIDEHPSSKGGSSGNPMNLSREELAAQKTEIIEDKVRTALEFKKELDNKQQKELDEFDAAREKHEKALLAWATNNKEKRNVRTLLTTMHTVLPPGNKWKDIGLGDVLEPSQVKKQYRKAMLVVHPDHTIGADSEAKFICKRVFEAINEAYDDFLKKEGL